MDHQNSNADAGTGKSPRLPVSPSPRPSVSPSPRLPLPVIIIGGGMGGLSAAIHLRLAGYEVTIYEANERVGGRANLIERDGFRFDTGPSLLNYPWVFERLFEAAGRRLGDYVSCSRSTFR